MDFHFPEFPTALHEAEVDGSHTLEEVAVEAEVLRLLSGRACESAWVWTSPSGDVHWPTRPLRHLARDSPVV